MDNRGIYSMFSGFLLIVLIIAGLLFMVYISFTSKAQFSVFSSSAKTLQQSGQVKEKILNCLKDLNETNLTDAQSQGLCLNPLIDGYSLEMQDFLGCTKRNWQIGNPSCKKAFVYLVNIYNVRAQNCLGKMKICFKEN